MIFHRIVLLFFASIIACTYSAPIHLRPSNNNYFSIDDSAPIQHSKRGRTPASYAQQAARIKDRITAALKPKRNKAVFWSGSIPKKSGPGYKSVSRDAQKYAKDHGMQTVNHALRDAKIRVPNAKNNPHSESIWDHASRIWAQRASGKVPALLGTVVRPMSVYNRVEKPALIANKKVTELHEHNLHTGEKTQIKPAPAHPPAGGKSS